MKEVYLDAAANVFLDKKVYKAMKPYLKSSYMGNSFAIHDLGIKANIAVEDARYQIAKDLGYKSSEVYFTSGATESNNWVIQSLSLHELMKAPGEPTKRHIICSMTEHSSILNTCKMVEKWGMEVTYVKPNEYGWITRDEIAPLLRPDTLLVCVMAVNNELGTENDNIGPVVEKNGSLSLVDCTQAFSLGGKYVELSNRYTQVNYLSFSGHKIYGPTGTGCLIVKEGSPLYPFIIGGSQESGKRGGTSNVAGIVGIANAIKQMHLHDYREHFRKLLDYLAARLCYYKLGLVNCNSMIGHENIVNLDVSRYCHYDNLAAILATEGICVSAGSACDAEHDETKGDFNGSHVLIAIGLNEDVIRNSIRVSFSKNTTCKDIDALLKAIVRIRNK